MKRDHQIARMPSTHCEGQRKEHPLERGEASTVRNQLDSHPQRQECGDAVANEL